MQGPIKIILWLKPEAEKYKVEQKGGQYNYFNQPVDNILFFCEM